ncbi:hypothetical protein SAMN02745702_01418 [Desulfobaculum bizertense DSM 18034]|uniref:Uncharacterized protein n=1 Tax=Desulfobaculum bizertense DSM 18034 TaxID=1121442 RepID=A0A1T4W233_9BACT|nr:hypothetical protein SAMN02745702_01418 [Desulfobaculum bizertense DSM 18034]
MKGKAKGFHSSGPFFSGEIGIPKGLVLGQGQGAAPLAEHETESRNLRRDSPNHNNPFKLFFFLKRDQVLI